MHGGTFGRDAQSGPSSAAYLPQRPTQEGAPAAGGLPVQHGLPLFEFAVVDPEWVFVSWETTPAQGEAARTAYGEEWFSERRLVVVFQRAGTHGELTRVELFGDWGCWFQRLDAPGARVVARLGFEARGARYELTSAGPLQVPRTAPIEPEKYRELSVAYAVDITGRLSIAAWREARHAVAPVGALPAGAPAGLRLAGGGRPGSAGLGGASPRGGVGGGAP